MIIDDKIIEKTTKCLDNFGCLKDENHPCLVMGVDFCIAGKVHYVDCSKKSCNYKMGYGDSTICNCPTRKEIFNKYNL
jgi:hypothetical protein